MDHESYNPLGLTSAAFVEAARGRVRHRGLGGRAGAMSAYRALFREGEIAAPRGLCGCATGLVAPIVREVREESPEGTVVKFLQCLPAPGAVGVGRTDGASGRPGAGPVEIESVLIPMVGSTGRRTYTLCVSSQVGCAMGCTFCETAQMGLVRSLTAAEIVGQWYAAVHVLGFAVKNIVFMGMGEPLDNYENVVQAIDVLKDHKGAGVPVSQITVSTVGRVDGLKRLAEQVKRPGWHRLGIALSLNAPNDAVRSALMPINRKWGLAEVRGVLADWPRFAGNKICVEYVLIPGVNDAPEHAAEIAAFMELFKGERGKPRAMLNLIPYNPRRDSPWPAPEEARVEWFLNELIRAGVFVKRRRTKGRAMMGACGQLGAAHIRNRRYVEATVSA